MSKTAAKPFFFRLEPAQLLSALIQIPEAERGGWITRVALELASGTPVDPFSVSLFAEVAEFRKVKAIAGAMGGKAKAQNRASKT